MAKTKFTTDEKTSDRMRHVKTRNTTPEIIVREIFHEAGYQFLINNEDLPGKPDIVFPSFMAVVFIHGCFWHGHTECKKGTIRPKNNAELWENKIQKNILKDLRNIKDLESLGWRVIIIWECQINKNNRTWIINSLNQMLPKS